MDAIAPEKASTLQKIDLYTSHEALNLYYESAQTRRFPEKVVYNLAHILTWLGNPTAFG